MFLIDFASASSFLRMSFSSALLVILFWVFFCSEDVFAPFLKDILTGENVSAHRCPLASCWGGTRHQSPPPLPRSCSFSANLSFSLQLWEIFPLVFCNFPEVCLAVDFSLLGIHRESCICGLVYLSS